MPRKMKIKTQWNIIIEKIVDAANNNQNCMEIPLKMFLAWHS